MHEQSKAFLPYKKHLEDASIDQKNGKGIMGVCIFRELAYFDVGRSFIADSLHNIYIGSFVRICFF